MRINSKGFCIALEEEPHYVSPCSPFGVTILNRKIWYESDDPYQKIW